MQEITLDFKKLSTLDWDRLEVMPVAVQDLKSREVLMVAYANLQALQESFKRKVAVFWSTSRDELWIKGETSGDTLHLKEVRVNCYGNSLLYLVELEGKGMCHTQDSEGHSRFGCYYRALADIRKSEMISTPPYSGS